MMVKFSYKTSENKKKNKKIEGRVLTWIGAESNSCARNVIEVEVRFFPTFKVADLSS